MPPRNLRYDVLHARVGFLDRRAVEDRQQHAGDNEHHEQEVGDPAKRVPPADVGHKPIAKRLAECFVDSETTIDGTVQKPEKPGRSEEARVGAFLDVGPDPTDGAPDMSDRSTDHGHALPTYTTPSRRNTGNPCRGLVESPVTGRPSRSYTT